MPYSNGAFDPLRRIQEEGGFQAAWQAHAADRARIDRELDVPRPTPEELTRRLND